MTVSLDEIRNRLSPRFPDVEQVTDSAIRFTRKSEGRPFAVCYVDVGVELPSSLEALDAYQDFLVGKRYFDGDKSLQWSTYLYFVVEQGRILSATLQEVKAIIESDRKYARKYVITEEELDEALNPPPIYGSGSAEIETGILTTWFRALEDANLDRAVLNDESLPRRIEMIESSFGLAALPTPAASSIRATETQPSLRRLTLKDYRDFPSQKEFDLVDVNLLYGTNGTGKTSLLEAVELLYCGRTNRDPKSKPNYQIGATFTDGTAQTATNERAPALFRERNLLWYGQAESRTNSLYQSFSRFNFLNTDAAVSLAESDEDIEKDLTNLLVGPEASKAWREINRTSTALDAHVKKLDAVLNETQLRLASINRQLEITSEDIPESNAVHDRLTEKMKTAKWEMPEGTQAQVAGELVKAFVELQTLIDQAASMVWVGTPVTLQKLSEFVSASTEKHQHAAKLLNESKEKRKNEREISKRIANLRRLWAEASEIFRYVVNEFTEKLSKSAELKQAAATSRTRLKGLDESAINGLDIAKIGTAATWFDEVASSIESKADALSNTEEKYRVLSSGRERTAKLSQELRSIASQLLQNSAKPDACPLCHHQFEPGKLVEQIEAGIDKELEAKAAPLIDEIRKLKDLLQSLRSTKRVATWIEEFCLRSETSTSQTLNVIVQKVFDERKNAKTIDAEIASLDSELTQLAKDGITQTRYEELRSRIDEIVGENVLTAKKSIGNRISKLESDGKEANSELNAVRKEVLSISQSLDESLGTENENAENHEAALTTTHEQLTKAKAILEALTKLKEAFPWEEVEPLAEVGIRAETVRKLAAEFQSTSARERKAVTQRATAIEQKEEIEQQLATRKQQVNSFRKAKDVLAIIQSEHSLNSAVEQSLHHNRIAIEAIFRRIHSPSEFSGLGDSLTTLVRKNDKSTSGLHQISTGQRAAFALSLFLAQNAQLRYAPPVMLIDDPVSHVDDLNCLSFLDFLRDVVLSSDRQLVFATADEKLAKLFERKFDFLGEERFRRFNLSRSR